MNIPNYEIEEKYKSKNLVNYMFVSSGNKRVTKAIQYAYLNDLNDVKIYNLGFGNYNKKQNTIDNEVTGNGDAYLVFNTVLSTIPKFFELFQDVAILVVGSDSSEEFAKKCRLTCTKKCVGFCKNQHRRIKTYMHYLNKNFDRLSKDYNFKSVNFETDNQHSIEQYVPHKNYTSILILKKTVN